MTIAAVYERYKIVPFLQLHQLRVAAVARLICGSLAKPVDVTGVTAAALLHDMGNILKFNFATYPDVFEPEGIPYWEHVRDEYRTKYGNDEHDATFAIARELGVSNAVFSYISAVGFSNVAANLDDPSMEKKICCYADQRVGPFGVLSITERLAEGAKRYANHPDPVHNARHFRRSGDGLYALEQQIFADSSMRPSDITDSSIATSIAELRKASI